MSGPRAASPTIGSRWAISRSRSPGSITRRSCASGRFMIPATSRCGHDRNGPGKTVACFPYACRVTVGGARMLTVLNVLWFILGGFLAGLGWWLAGILCAITIVGLPWARACFMLGNFSFWPFGRDVISRKELTGRDDLGTGTFGTIGNIIWLIF